jgi:hypothetical protein
MTMLKADYPQFKPKREMNGILIYEFAKLKYYLGKSDDDGFGGASCIFLENNASINVKDQFGLKVFWSEKEAKNAWIRQRKAAKIGLAPPVGKRIVLVDKYNQPERWGYQTCCADMIQTVKNLEKVCKAMKILLGKISVPTDDLPTQYATNLPCVMGGDLHCDNIGVWCGRYVCVDFGHHTIIHKSGRALRGRPWAALGE